MTQAQGPDFQNYLQSVCTKYKRWWNLYTLTDTLGKQQPENEELNSPFDFGQTVQTLSTKQPQEKQSPEKTERMPVLAG